MSIEVKVPRLPESVADATLVAWHKAVGDIVERDENLADLETDKVVLEVPAPARGVLRELRVKGGATVTSGQLLAMLEPAAEGEVAKAAPAPRPRGRRGASRRRPGGGRRRPERRQDGPRRAPRPGGEGHRSGNGPRHRPGWPDPEGGCPARHGRCTGQLPAPAPAAQPAGAAAGTVLPRAAVPSAAWP